MFSVLGGVRVYPTELLRGHDIGREFQGQGGRTKFIERNVLIGGCQSRARRGKTEEEGKA